MSLYNNIDGLKYTNLLIKTRENMTTTSIKEFLETVPSICHHNFKDETLEESAREIERIERDLSHKKDSFRKECLEFLEKQNIITPNYTFDKTERGHREGIDFIFKFKTAYNSISVKDALMKEMKEISRPCKPQIRFSNLNDLNSAKFLTDDEKRSILGLPPQKEEIKS